MNENISCKSYSILYCITCNNYGEEHISQIGKQLTACMRVHRQQINDTSNRNTPCSEHFDICDCITNIVIFLCYSSFVLVQIIKQSSRGLFHECCMKVFNSTLIVPLSFYIIFPPVILAQV